MSHLHDALEELDYPVDHATAVEHFDGTTLRFADGEADLSELLAAVPGGRYHSSEDLEADLHSTLPRSAVGEPYQSEGDA